MNKRTSDLDFYIGQKVRLFRKQNNMAIKDLAFLLKISYQQLAKYEHGINRVSASTLFKIAEILKVDLLKFYP